MKTTLKTKTKIRFEALSDVPGSYVKLVQMYIPRPIHNAEELGRATEMLDALVVFERLNADQLDYLDALSHFIEEFEGPVKVKISGRKALKSLVKDHGLSGRELSKILGASPMLGSMILRGKREITANHARTLGKYFSVSPGFFL